MLDEPTTNLGIQRMEILTALNGCHGTLLVVAHDAYLLEAQGIVRAIRLPKRFRTSW